MTYTIDEVVKAYVDIREQKRDMEKAHERLLEPVNEKLAKIETWLLAKMNEDGVENYKTKSGTAYKSVKVSCQMADSNFFKEFVFAPVIKAIGNVLENFGVDRMETAIKETVLQSAQWNLVDFRALKKGVEEYIEDTKQVPPGLNVTQTTTVNVRSK